MNQHILTTIIQRALNDSSFRKQLSHNPQAALAGYDLSQADNQLIQQGLAAESFDLNTSGLEQRISRSRLPMGILFGFFDSFGESDGSAEASAFSEASARGDAEPASAEPQAVNNEINFDEPELRVDGMDASQGPGGAPIRVPGGGRTNAGPSLPGNGLANEGDDRGGCFYHHDHGKPHVHCDSTPVYHYDEETGGGWVEEFDYGRAQREWDMWQMEWNDRYANDDDGEGGSAANVQDFPASKVAGWRSDEDEDPLGGYDDDDENDDGSGGSDDDDNDGDGSDRGSDEDDDDDNDGDGGDDGDDGDNEDDDDDEDGDDEGGEEGYGDDGCDGNGRGPGFGGLPGSGSKSGPVNGDGRDDDFGVPKGFGLPSGGGEDDDDGEDDGSDFGQPKGFGKPSGGGSIVDPEDLDYNEIGSTVGDQAQTGSELAGEANLASNQVQADAGNAPLNAEQQSDVIS